MRDVNGKEVYLDDRVRLLVPVKQPSGHAALGAVGYYRGYRSDWNNDTVVVDGGDVVGQVYVDRSDVSLVREPEQEVPAVVRRRRYLPGFFSSLFSRTV